MGHKDYKTINLWLRDLRDNHYVEWIYSTDFYEKSKPAIYYLGINAIRYLKETKLYPVDELRKRYREPSRSKTYIDRCVILASICITLGKMRTDEPLASWYYYETESDYLNNGYFNFLKDSELIHPHLCVSKEEYAVSGEQYTSDSYVLEVFDNTLPRYRVRKRLKDYIEYLESDEWQDETSEEKPPIVLFVCPTKVDLIYCKRATRRLLENTWDDANIHMRFGTVDNLNKQGFMAKIWEEVQAPKDE